MRLQKYISSTVEDLKPKPPDLKFFENSNFMIFPGIKVQIKILLQNCCEITIILLTSVQKIGVDNSAT